MARKASTQLTPLELEIMKILLGRGSGHCGRRSAAHARPVGARLYHYPNYAQLARKEGQNKAQSCGARLCLSSHRIEDRITLATFARLRSIAGNLRFRDRRANIAAELVETKCIGLNATAQIQKRRFLWKRIQHGRAE